jgi:hypothetical protein
VPGSISLSLLWGWATFSPIIFQPFSTLKAEVACFSEALISTYKFTISQPWRLQSEQSRLSETQDVWTLNCRHIRSRVMSTGEDENPAISYFSFWNVRNILIWFTRTEVVTKKFIFQVIFITVNTCGWNVPKMPTYETKRIHLLT